jgi:hypothetical protein
MSGHKQEKKQKQTMNPKKIKIGNEDTWLWNDNQQ